MVGKALLLAAAATTASAGTTPDGTHFGDSGVVKLNNGLDFPLVSFGLQVYDDTTADQYTRIAVAAGIRNFFSSVLASNQAGFSTGLAGGAAKASLKREDFFVCGSVNTGSGMCQGFDDCKAQTVEGCHQNLKTLGQGSVDGGKTSFLGGYVDMIMLDYPASDCDSIQGQWAAFEEMLANKTTKSIAVSNFGLDQLACISNNSKTGEKGTAPTIPAVNQMPYSIGSGSTTTVADDYARGGILVQAYSPLGGGGVIQDPDCIAIGKAHNKSSAQVALRWIIQRNASFTTSASTLEHFQDDADIFDFSLNSTEMSILNAK